MRNTPSEVLRYAAFTDSGKGGNPAGVVLDARSLGEADMLAIAQEVGYSETAFVLPTPEPAAFRVRYFSPKSEVAFCGHATVAAAVALAERDGPGEFAFTTLAGPITVNTVAAEHGVTATLTSPATRTRPVTESVLSVALAAIGWEREDLDPTYPPHVAFAGNHHLVLGVSRFATLVGLDYDFHQLSGAHGPGALDDRPHVLGGGRRRLPCAQRLSSRRCRRGPGYRSSGGGLRRLPAHPGPRRPACTVDPAARPAPWFSEPARRGCRRRCRHGARHRIGLSNAPAVRRSATERNSTEMNHDLGSQTGNPNTSKAPDMRFDDIPQPAGPSPWQLWKSLRRTARPPW